MIVVKTKIELKGRRVEAYCPYCRTQQAAQSGLHIYTHNCPDAGMVFFLNGNIFVGVPNYLSEEKASVEKH